MVTRSGIAKIRQRGQRPRYLYITEWMEYLGLNDEVVAGRIWWNGKEGVDRVTVTRWRKHQNRLNPEKIAALASALDISPEELWRPPPPKTRPSIDGMLRKAPDAIVQEYAEYVEVGLRRRGIG